MSLRKILPLIALLLSLGIIGMASVYARAKHAEHLAPSDGVAQSASATYGMGATQTIFGPKAPSAPILPLQTEVESHPLPVAPPR